MRVVNLVGLVLASLLTVHGLRASVAQIRYHRVRYGADRANAEALQEGMSFIHRWYPWHDRACMAIASAAYRESRARNEPAEGRFRTVAGRWCDEGLRLNPYKRQLNLLKTRLLAEQSLPAAITWWERYVRWHFWDPFNHRIRVELYARQGDYAAALDALEWTRGSDQYERARSALRAAWSHEAEAGHQSPAVNTR